MKLLYELTLVSNILVIVITSIGLFYQFNDPKKKATYGYVMAAGMILYLVLLLLLAILILIFNHSINVVYLLCLASPFVIGKLVKHGTLKKYTVIQILCFCLSLFDIMSKLL